MKMQKSSHPRILLTAPKSGSGKTLVTCALISAFKSRGFRVSACKCGPDYIDPMFHRAVSGVRAGNIDTFFTDDELTRAILGMYAENADLTILEGAMGYYDGMGGTSACASAYETAAVTDTPALLVVDAKGAALSLAAVIGGVLAFRREARTDSGICGVILNRVSEAFYPRLAGVIEENCGIPVLLFRHGIWGLLRRMRYRMRLPGCVNWLSAQGKRLTLTRSCAARRPRRPYRVAVLCSAAASRKRLSMSGSRWRGTRHFHFIMRKMIPCSGTWVRN